MTQIYFKLICHNPDYAHKLPVFWGLQSTTDTNFTQKIENETVNNYWYNLNDYVKKARPGVNLSDSKRLHNLKVLYLYEGEKYNTYTLPWIMFSCFRTKSDADNFSNPLAKDIQLFAGAEEQNGYGNWINLAPSSFDLDLTLDDSKTYYVRYDISNRNAGPYNRPIIILNHNQNFNIEYNKTYPWYIRDTINDIYEFGDNSVTAVRYTGNDPLKVDFIYNGNHNKVTVNNGNAWRFSEPLPNGNNSLDVVTNQPSTAPATVTISKDNDSDPYSISPTHADVGKATKITLTANTGYYFTTAYYDINSNFDNLEHMTISDDGLTATFTFTPSDKNDSRVVHAVTNKLTDNKVDFHGDNATCSPLTFPLGKDTIITVKPSPGYELVQTYYKINPNSDDMNDFTNVSPEQATTVVNEKLPVTLYVYTTTKAKEAPKRQQVPITFNLTHCAPDITTLTENNADKWPNDFISKTVTLNADQGYIFDKDVIYRSYSRNLSRYISDTVKATNTNKIQIDIMAGPADSVTTDIDRHPSITAVANKQTEPISTGLDSIHLYKMRNAELDNLSNKLVMYYKQNDTGTSDLDTYDYTRFINQVYRLPLAIPPELLKATDHVSAGVFNLAENTTSITKDTFDLNVGQIAVTGKDASDYNVLKATLVLPFIDNQALNINDILDNTITITYRINLLNGIATLVVNNQQGNLITQNYNISTQLQLFGAYYDKQIKALNSVLNNKLRQAYLIVTYKEPILNLKTYSTNEHGVLKSYVGLTKAINPTINFTCNNAEYDTIVSGLESGVIIK